MTLSWPPPCFLISHGTSSNCSLIILFLLYFHSELYLILYRSMHNLMFLLNVLIILLLQDFCPICHFKLSAMRTAFCRVLNIGRTVLEIYEGFWGLWKCREVFNREVQSLNFVLLNDNYHPMSVENKCFLHIISV